MPKADCQRPLGEVPEGIVDSVRVKSIVMKNYDRSLDYKEKAKVIMQPDGYMVPLPLNHGIWIVPTFFRHSCVPNCQKMILSDFFQFYAFEDIKKGDVLTWAYQTADSDRRDVKV